MQYSILKLFKVFRAALALLIVSNLVGCAVGSLKTDAPSITTASIEDIQPSDPVQPLVVAIYKFTDQSGQHLNNNRFQSLSSALPQGLSSMLSEGLINVGLKTGSYYRVVERDAIDQLLNERRIAAATLQEQKQTPLRSLLLPGIIFTGGVVSLDHQTYSKSSGFGFSGFSLSGSREMDTVTIAIRAVSVQTGEVVASSIVSKTIVSVTSGIHGLKVFDTNLAEIEIGGSKNEPISLAMRAAVNLAIKDITRKGVEKNWWKFSSSEDHEQKEVNE